MAKWAYLATAPNQVVAEMWQEMLDHEHIAAMLQPADTVSFIGISTSPVRMMVPEDRLDAARALLAEWEESDDAEDETEESDESEGR